MSKRSPVLVCLAIALAAVVATGCESETGVGGGAGPCPTIVPPSCDNTTGAGDVMPFVTPLTIHTGANGRDLYQAVLVANFGDLAVTTLNEAVVCAAKYSCPAPSEQAIVAVLTAQNPGSANVEIESDGLLWRTLVKVESYTAADHDLGEARYLSPDNANATDRMPCGDCHLGQGGAPHSPLALARYSDTELIQATRTSQYPGACEDGDGVACDCAPVGADCSACASQCRYNDGQVLSMQAFGGGPGDHVFDLTAEEAVGIMAYMRALRPQGL